MTILRQVSMQYMSRFIGFFLKKIIILRLIRKEKARAPGVTLYINNQNCKISSFRFPYLQISALIGILIFENFRFINCHLTLPFLLVHSK